MLATPWRVAARLAGALGLAAMLMGATVGSSQFGVQSVTIKGFAFSPGSITVRVGDSVEWTNNDAVAHTATADDGSWNAGTIAAGQTAQVSFDAAGTFPYHCAIHASMHGTVVVEAAAPATDTADPPAPAGWTGARSGSLLAVGTLLTALMGVHIGRRRRARRDPD